MIRPGILAVAPPKSFVSNHDSLLYHTVHSEGKGFLRERAKVIEERGFAVLPWGVSEGDVGRVAEELASSKMGRSRAGLRHALRYPAVAAIARDPRLLEIARAVLGDGALPFRATLFDKSRSSNWLVAWHQDTALPLREKREASGWGPWSVKDGVTYAHAPATALEQVVALRVHLDDSTAENGPLRVLPGKHRMGVLSDDEIHELARRVAPVECCVARCGIVAMRPLLVHASSKSRSEALRRVLHIEYAASKYLGEDMELAVD